MTDMISGVSGFSAQDIYLFKEGTHYQLYDKLGSHLCEHRGEEGTRFAVWAPEAESVSVIGDLNGWRKGVHCLERRGDSSGIWEGFLPGVGKGARYKYHIVSKHGAYEVDKADPYCFRGEMPPSTASVVWDLEYEWNDTEWMSGRDTAAGFDRPVSVYEVHLGSWRRKSTGKGEMLSYREIAPLLSEYVNRMGFTHVELMPVMEHPFYGSWGYQVGLYYAPSRRYGDPQGLMYLIDHLHQKGIGVILDWVPSHFPSDSYSLSFFDGTYLYEHSDPRKGFHPEWKSCVFNCGRNEVKNFLISNAAYWIDKYHADGLRVDAVASMLYLDYSRKRGEWVPNIYGDRENLEAIEFLRDLNKFLYEKYPGIQTIAEESTAWPMVTRPPYLGGLGFGYKWNMGWMHDVLSYMEKEPVYRKYHHGQLTFTLWYAFNENFVLPLSHDEVVYGKRSLAGKMPGDDWQKLANLRLLFGYMFTHPGKKHLFMGGEFGQWGEWDHDSELEWHLLDKEQHRGVQKWVSDLNRLYRNERALFDKDVESEGFQWINLNDQDNSVISFLRSGKDMARCLVVACNFTPVVRYDYLLGVPFGGEWKEIINSDSELYGGSGVGNLGRVNALDDGSYGRDFSIRVTLPPLGMVVLKHGDIEDVGGSKV